MNLTEFYETRGVKERMREKDVVLIIPSEDYDYSWFLSGTGLDPYEVATTWPKEGVSIVDEVTVAEPYVVFQLGERQSRRFPFIGGPNDLTPEVIERMPDLFDLPDAFVPLHHHDEYSLKDGLGTVDQLARMLVRQRRSFCCVTNHGSIGGWIKQYNACHDHGLKPIFGMEAYVSDYRGDDPELKKANRSAAHLVLLAMTEEGFRNIIRIHNDAHLEGFYYSPRMNHDAAKKWGKGIVATSACFPLGTIVFQGNGFVRIEDVVDEYVVSHKGELRRSTPTGRTYRGTMRRVTSTGVALPIEATSGHEFLIVKKEMQRKVQAPLLSRDEGWCGVDNQVRRRRRRDFHSEWTNNIEVGDWLLYPVEKYQGKPIDAILTSEYNEGSMLTHRVLISDSGLSHMRDMRRRCGKTIGALTREGAWTKSNLYKIEKGCAKPRRERLFPYLESIGVDPNYFFETYCHGVSSQDCGLIKNKLPSEIEISPRLLFILGAYCAEGSSSGYSAVFTLSSEEVEFANEIITSIDEVFGLKSSWKVRGTRGDVVVPSLPIVNFLSAMCGSGAGGKKVPNFVFSLDFSMSKHFLRGYLMGDGSWRSARDRSGGGIVSASVSQMMSMGIARILLGGGYYPTSTKSPERIGENGTHHREAYYVSVNGKQHRPLARFVWCGEGDGILPKRDMVSANIPISSGGIDYYTSRVTEVEEWEDTLEVRCLSVERDESFIVGFSSVHNCLGGEIPRLLMSGQHEEAEALCRFYMDCFDDFYLEIQIIEYEEQREANHLLIRLAQKIGAPLILACDSHYLVPEHAETHDLLMYIRQGKTRQEVAEKDEDVWDFEVRNLFYRTGEQMRRVWTEGFVDREGHAHKPFKDSIFTEDILREAMGNTLKVARQAEDIKMDSTVKLPKLYQDSARELKKKVNEGYRRLELGKLPNKQEYIDRLKHEFGVIAKLGWADYFLVMERIVTMARTEFYDEVGDWAVGTGRGSAAGSLVSWCLGITDCDPIRHSLLFERFLDSERSDPPDIDLDFHPRIRQRVKDRIVEVFGEDKTCSIGTYSTYKTRAVIIDVARAIGLDVGEANAVTKKMEPLQSFENDDGDSEIVDKMDFDDLRKHYPELDAYFKLSPEHAEVLVHAEVIRNQVRNMGKHAGGVIISDLNLKGRIPVQRDASGAIISSWAESGNSAELSKVGYVKYDVLGLNHLCIISDCIELIRENQGVRIARPDIPDDDKLAIKMQCKSDLVGIFQLESPATKPVIDAVKVDSLDDISAVTSLIRPGPKDMGMHMQYAENKNGAFCDVPECIRDILEPSHGVLVFQEQAMSIAKKMSGFTGSEANLLRKAIGKKKEDLMAKMKEKFISGAQVRVGNGEITKKEVEYTYDLIESFAGYGFNKSIDKDTNVMTVDGTRRIEDVCAGQQVWCFDGDGYALTEVVALHNHGVLPGIEVTFDDGSVEVCTVNHKFLTRHGQVPIRDILKRDLGVLGDANDRDSMPRGISARKVLYARFVGERQMYDLEVHHKAHNFVLASGLISSNSHAVSYSMISTYELWLKHNYFREYMCALLRNTKSAKKSHTGGVAMVEYINYSRRRGVEVLGPSVNDKHPDFYIDRRGNIVYGLSHVRNVASAAEHIVKIAAQQPFTSMQDFYDRCIYEVQVKSGINAGRVRRTRPNKSVVESLINAGAFDEFGSREEMHEQFTIASLGIPNYTDETWEDMKERVCPDAEPNINDPMNTGLEEIKGCKDLAQAVAEIVADEKFKSMADFYDRCVFEVEVKSGKNAGLTRLTRPSKKVVETLIAAGAFRDFGGRQKVIRSYYLAKNDVEFKTLSKSDVEALEIEMLGLCLSVEPLCRRFSKVIRNHKWCTIGEHANQNKPIIFGRIEKIERKTSRAGNPMMLVKIGDGMDTLEFFVFRSGMQHFDDRAKVGSLVAVPMNRFDGSLTRFYDDRKEIVRIKTRSKL
jgi:DNA polymerase III alpha subunit